MNDADIGLHQRRVAIVARAISGVSIQAIADEHGISRQRVSQIVIAATGKKRGRPGTRTEIDWTPELVKQLRLEWDAGHSTAEIGRRLGISKNAVVGKASRLDLPARPSPIIRDPDDPRRRRDPQRGSF